MHYEPITSSVRPSVRISLLFNHRTDLNQICSRGYLYLGPSKFTFVPKFWLLACVLSLLPRGFNSCLSFLLFPLPVLFARTPTKVMMNTSFWCAPPFSGSVGFDQSKKNVRDWAVIGFAYVIYVSNGIFITRTCKSISAVHAVASY